MSTQQAQSKPDKTCARPLHRAPITWPVTCIDVVERIIRELMMSWAAVFWILYGVGSTLFVVYLFKLGNSVASNRKELVRQEIERIRRGETDDVTEPVTASARIVSREQAPDSASRLHVKRIFQPNDQYVAVQGVRDGSTCVINLPIGMAVGIPTDDPETRSRAEKALQDF